eukprot:10279582-Prorocentrum_lima.AAC.1
MKKAPLESGAIPKDTVTIGTLPIRIKVTDKKVSLVRESLVTPESSLVGEKAGTLGAAVEARSHLRNLGVAEWRWREPAPEGSREPLDQER